MSTAARPRVASATVLAATLAALVLPTTVAAQPTAVPSGTDRPAATRSAATRPFALVEDRDVDDRLATPEDRYAVAGGCYTLAGPGGALGRTGDALIVVDDRGAALPLHFQPTRLGEYLLAADEGPADAPGAWWSDRDYVSAADLLRAAGADGPTGALDVGDVAAPVVGTDVVLADDPGRAGEWSLQELGDGTWALVAVERDLALGLDGDTPSLVALDDPAAALEISLAGPAGSPGCAVWPEITTDTSGPPAPTGKGPADRVEGFFEAHVHGMAFEFLGGALRCGRPWHPYGVEHALGNCFEEEAGHTLQGVLEVGLAGQDPQSQTVDYDPQGWPTFASWPNSDMLTHEQFYWKWLERAHHGGLRLLTNLLVDNTALCTAYPFKKNSCNEMDGVRLQAQRMYELQDYVDAQSGGPGEGWLRIVTTPAQARAAINAGRLAVVLGIEVSVLFDCGEVLDVPQCTPDQVDDRLQEAFDMGVRQMELVNKFDNALTGVKGDGGSTGIVVNQGNKYVTGHWWDMRTCPPTPDGEAHEHDHRQVNFSDDRPQGGPDEIDVLAGTVLGLFGPTRGAAAPLYPAGPHCNSRGLTDLGRHLIRGMVERGMIFDPDHMSAAAQREALAFIRDELVPAERAAAAAEGRPPVLPAVMSSHSWANDATYQRIYDLQGHVAPRTAPSDVFVERWQQRRAWAAERGIVGDDFGLGYGADTNGLGSQPGRRRTAGTDVDYTDGFPAAIGDVTVFQHTSGTRTFDVNTDGVSHYGLFADWYHEVALAADDLLGPGAGEQVTRDLLNGSESYLRLWERAVYGGNDCVTDGSMPQVEDLHALVGLEVERFLAAVGQPMDRDGAAYRYCALDAEGRATVTDVLFDRDGRAASVAVVAPAEALVDPAASTGGSAAASTAVTRDDATAPTDHTATVTTADATAPALVGDAHGHVHAAAAGVAIAADVAGTHGPGTTATLSFLLAGLGGAALLRRRGTA